MNERRRGMTRRDFMELAAKGGLLLTAGALGGSIAQGEIDSREIERQRAALKNLQSQNFEALYLQEELVASLYFERLKNTIHGYQTGTDEISKYFRDVFLGNVNDFDRNKKNLSRGAYIVTSFTGVETVVTIDETGKQTVTTEGESEESTEVEISVPDFITDITERKKSDIKILYLDSGANHPFKDRFAQIGDQIQDAVKKLLPQINVNVADTEVIPWDPNTKVYFGGVSGGIEEDTIQDGKFRLSDKYRYLLFAESPLMTYSGIFSDDTSANGISILQNNIAVVNLFNFEKDSPHLITTALQEIGHSYGLDHCWENDCAMSYRMTSTDNFQIDSTSYGPRCLMIGTNIAGGHIEYVKDPKNPAAYFASGRLIPADLARQDLETHISGYISDIAGEIPEGILSTSIIDRDKDTVLFTIHNKGLANLFVKEYLSSVDTFQMLYP